MVMFKTSSSPFLAVGEGFLVWGKGLGEEIHSRFWHPATDEVIE
jgi:hypothetical protein